MAQNIKGTIDQDGGSSTQLRSMQQCNCRSACRRSFPTCSMAMCVWFLVIEAAAVHSSRIPPHALCYRVHPGALPSSLHARCQCLGLAHDHTHLCACGCAGRGVMMQLPAAKTAMQTRLESMPPGPLLFLRPFTFISHLTRHNKHTHEDTYREDIERFQWRSPWHQWRSQWPTTTTAGRSPRIT